MTLYGLPPAQVTLVVPAGYRGPITVELRGPAAGEGEPHMHGKRSFDLMTSPRGHVRVDRAPALLRRVSPASYVARDSDGAQVAHVRFAAARARALRWVSSQGDRHVFVVGDQEERNNLQARLYEVAYRDGSKVISVDPARFHAVFDDLVAEESR